VRVDLRFKFFILGEEFFCHICIIAECKTRL
jgi:hypothetical protein